MNALIHSLGSFRTLRDGTRTTAAVWNYLLLKTEWKKSFSCISLVCCNFNDSCSQAPSLASKKCKLCGNNNNNEGNDRIDSAVKKTESNRVWNSCTRSCSIEIENLSFFTKLKFSVLLVLWNIVFAFVMLVKWRYWIARSDDWEDSEQTECRQATSCEEGLHYSWIEICGDGVKSSGNIKSHKWRSAMSSSEL